MAEDLTEYMHEAGMRVRYMHSDIETLERIEIIRDLRLGAFDVLIGINLLREGLDIPECGLVAILDADKEGFLRSETSLIQTIGRAARNVDGRVILYADRITGSMERAIAETDRRREKQVAYNAANGITPESIKRNIHDMMALGLRAGPRDGRHRAARDAPLVGHNLRGRHRGPGAAHARRRPPTSSSRRRRACATRSSGCARPSSPSPTIPWRGSRRSRTGPARFKGARKYGAKANLPSPATGAACLHAAHLSPRGERVGEAGRHRRTSVRGAPPAPQPSPSRGRGSEGDARASRPSTSRCSRRMRSRRSARRRVHRASGSRRSTTWAPAPTGRSAPPGARQPSRRSARQGRRVRRGGARAAQADARRDGPARLAADPAAGAPRPERPVRTIDVPTEAEKKGRRGRPRKTGRPGK